MRVRSLWIALLVALFATVPALAQGDRGSITGTVKDASGAVIPGAKVIATQVETNVSRTTETTASGDFTFPSLTIGNYSVRVEAKGFKAAIAKDINLGPNDVHRVDVGMELGETQQTVEVTTSVTQVQTENARVQTQVANKMVDELPMVVGGAVRSPFDLAILAPETKNVGNTDNNLALGGGQAASYGVTLDGISATTGRALQTVWMTVNTPSLDAISEFTVDTNGFKAEFSRAAGGAMTFVSKSGTNEFHGNAYEFLRNEKLDANFWFSNAANRARPVYKQNDFGGTVGGPVWIPKVYDGRNKTFFFTALEYFRNRQGASPSFLSVPPEEFYRGDLRNWVDNTGKQIQVYDPFTNTVVDGKTVRTPFSNNQIPQSMIDPISAKMVGFVSPQLKPNISGLVPGTSAYVRNNYIQAGSQQGPWDKFSVKGDHILNDKHRLSGYYGWNTRSTAPGSSGPIGLPGDLNNQNYNNTTSGVYRMSWDWSISPTKLNRFYAGGNNWAEINRALAVGSRDWSSVVCLKNVPDCTNNILSMGFSDFQEWGGPSDNGSENIVIGFNDDFSLIAGKHTMKMGYQYEQSRYNGFGQQWLSGRTNFNRLTTGVPGDTNQATGGGSSFASFLLGTADYGEIHTKRYIAQWFDYHGMYFQDDWRVSKKLTVNFGLRYEISQPPFEQQDRYSDFSPTTANPGADGRLGALLFAGSGEGRSGRRRLADTWYGGWGPRAGFAYSISNKDVLRGGIGRSFGAVRAVGGSTHFLGFVQIAQFPNTTQGVQPTFLLKDGMPAYPIPPFINPAFGNFNNVPWWQNNEVSRMPENITWTMTYQRQVSQNLLLEAGYNATLGSNLQAGLLGYNQLDTSLLPAAVNPFTAAGRSLLNSQLGSQAAINAGLGRPYPSFPTSRSVAQSLRPYPQYLNIDTGGGQGDRSGHSTYHSMVLKFEKRYGAGLTFLGSYVFSKILTDADSYWIGGQAMDHFNRGLEKSYGQFDQTHNFKFSYVYELPWGKGRKWLTNGGPLDWIVGGWRVGGIHLYGSGLPIALGTTIGFPIFNGGNRPTITTYEGWRANTSGDKFDPFKDRFFQPAAFFGPQPTDRLGNMTRYTGATRFFANLTENYSLAKSFNFTERWRLDFRAEAFNLANRTVFGPIGGAQTLQNENFGLWRAQSNDPRRMQMALKLYF